ncbi:D-amino acid dehydrogenase [Roseixanthobacter pseudopolyaromaticivorans]|uniref:D-amino acid dehydrogenase n=1 Tax=Xanthobacteraceae TaxID=335928 RepID=UPI00372993F8
MGHVIVIGAGITGVTTAYALLRRGHAVTVLERHPYAALETSFANGGQLSASNAEVWNQWSNVARGIRWIFTRSAPLLLNPKPSWHKMSWLAEFVGQIRRYEDNTIETVRLAIEARRHLFEIAEREGIAFDLEQRGLMHVYRDKASFAHATEVNALLKRGGLERAAVTPEEIKTIEPSLEGAFHGGFFTPRDASGDICRFTRGLAAACERLGGRFVHGVEVRAIRDGGNSRLVEWHGVDDVQAMGSLAADRVVICGGVGSRRLAALVGERLNVYPVKGYSITVAVKPEDVHHAPRVALLDDAAKIVTSRLGDSRFRIAGTAELNGYNRDVRADRTAPLVSWTRRHFPKLDTSDVAVWAGLRPMLPGMLPRVGASRRARNVFFNTGHGHLGWTLSCATAELVAAQMSA